jgi:hypothetical protein
MEDHFGNRNQVISLEKTNVPVFNNLFREKLTVMMKLLTLGALSAASIYFAQSYPATAIPDNLKKKCGCCYQKKPENSTDQ